MEKDMQGLWNWMGRNVWSRLKKSARSWQMNIVYRQAVITALAKMAAFLSAWRKRIAAGVLHLMRMIREPSRLNCASDTKHPYTMNSTVYATLIKLCVDICKRNGKKKLIWLGNKKKDSELLTKI